MVKICKKCGLPKDLNDFYKRKNGSADGHFHVCKSCQKLQNENWLEINREKDNARRKLNYKNKQVVLPIITEKEHEESLKAFLS